MKKRFIKFKENRKKSVKHPAKKTGNKHWQWTKTLIAKRVFSVSRWLHIYVSTALFSLLMFFCFTGITLNHAAWFTDEGEQQLKIAPLPQSLLNSVINDDELALFNLQQHIEKLIGLDEVRSIDIDRDVGEISFDYPIPAGYVFVTVYLDKSEIEIEQKKGSLIGLLNDLHKGRHSGEFWSWLIDISAGLILIFSLTGLVILLQNNKRRVKGIIYLLLGSVAPWFAYLLMVPRIS